MILLKLSQVSAPVDCDTTLLTLRLHHGQNDIPYYLHP